MILITRPLPDAERTAELLNARSHDTLVEPMLEIRRLNPAIPSEDIQAFILTSRNARHALPGKAMALSIPEHGKDGEEILEHAQNMLDKNAGKIIYLRGNIITLDIAGELSKQGFDADDVIVYESDPVKNFSRSFIEHLAKVTTATFFSKASYANFVKLCREENILGSLKKIKAVFLSETMVSDEDVWHSIYIADHPDLEHMVKKIDEIAKP